jgi:ribosome biogenesis GTPase A
VHIYIGKELLKAHAIPVIIGTPNSGKSEVIINFGWLS